MCKLNPGKCAGTQDEIEEFDHEAARREGWVLFRCLPYSDGGRHVQIQKLDSDHPPRFCEDREAWAHVVARARAGSRLHRRALDLIDARERMAILASFGAW